MLNSDHTKDRFRKSQEVYKMTKYSIVSNFTNYSLIFKRWQFIASKAGSRPSPCDRNHLSSADKLSDSTKMVCPQISCLPVILGSRKLPVGHPDRSQGNIYGQPKDHANKSESNL